MIRHLSAAIACSIAASAIAQVHTGDIILAVPDGKIATGTLTAGTFSEQRVFATRLGVSFPNFTGNPGFDSFPGTFTAGSRVGFTVQGPLKAWDGEGFDATPAERLEIAFNTLSVLTPLEAGETVPGFTLSVGSSGQWHRHYEYTLQAPASNGLYLLQLTLNGGGAQPSEPFWLIFAQNADDASIAAAVQWVTDTFVTPPALCPDVDFNQDGGIDVSDIASFFDAFTGADPAPLLDPDLNQDGGIDVSDISTFFAAFAGGPC